MGILKKYNEYFYGQNEGDIEGEMENSEMDMDSSDEEQELQKLIDGNKTMVTINGITVSLPSEMDGKVFLLDKGGKHIRRESAQEVLDVLTGKAVFESKKYKRHR
jgi:hypothetical protein